MNVSNPKVISALVSCPQRMLTQTAGKNGLKAAIASVVRDHWINRLTGVCVRCGYHIKKGECPKCHTMAPPSLFLLEQLDPKSPLIRGQCRKCQKDLVFKAGYVLGIIKKRGVFQPQGLCPRCLKDKRAPKSKESPAPVVPPPKAKEVKKVKPTPVVPRTDALRAERDKPLTHRPFAALAGVKIENPQL